MANTKILPDIQGESNEAPKKFTNIDKEGFEFWWDGKPFGGTFIDRMKSHEEEVINLDGKIERKIVYEFTKPIEPGETVIMPKYMVNYAAMHLARKMIKRENMAAISAKNEEFVKHAAWKVRDEMKEKETQEKIVAANFEAPKQPEISTELPKISVEVPKELPETETTEGKPEVYKPVDALPSSLICTDCGFPAKSLFGLAAHLRIKHNKK